MSPTLNPFTPVIDVVHIIGVMTSSMTLTVIFNYPAAYFGNIYCSTFITGSTISRSQVSAIIISGTVQSYRAGDLSSSISITGLAEDTDYDIYCLVVTANGVPSLYGDVLATKQSVTTACCKSITFKTAHPVVYGDLAKYQSSQASQYMFVYTLSSPPKEFIFVSVMILPITNSSKVWSSQV